MVRVLLLLILTLFSSCSLFRSGDLPLFDVDEKREIGVRAEGEFLAQLTFLGNNYISSEKKVVMRPLEEEYFSRIVTRISKANSAIFSSNKPYKVTLLEYNVPFHFALPDGQIILSKALLERFIKQEQLLVSILTYEMLRSELKIYMEQLLIPVKTVSVQRMLAMMKLPLLARTDLDRWTAYAMKRAEFDPFARLIWIQMVNKNALDFVWMVGDVQSIALEEFELKNFLIKEGLDVKSSSWEANSSDGYYALMKEIRKH